MNMGILTMFVSGGMIPTFLLFKELGLLNNFWVYIIPVLFSFYDMVILTGLFRSIPFSLEESAMMDGANPFIIFVKIILPLSLPTFWQPLHYSTALSSVERLHDRQYLCG